MVIFLKFITTDGDYPVSDYKSQLSSIISLLNGMMAQLLRRDYLVNNFPICLSILLKVSVSYLNRGSRENHLRFKLLPCLLSRFKLIAAKGLKRYPVTVKTVYPPLGEARLYHNVRVWSDGIHCCNLVLATVKGAKESWAVLTDEPPSLQTLWQYAFRFRVEELFLDSKSGAFELQQSHLRSTDALERLYLIAAIALLYATTQGMADTVDELNKREISRF
jgi:hypothetical protein